MKHCYLRRMLLHSHRCYGPSPHKPERAVERCSKYTTLGHALFSQRFSYLLGQDKVSLQSLEILTNHPLGLLQGVEREISELYASCSHSAFAVLRFYQG